MKAIIIDDESAGVSKLKILLKKYCPEVEVVEAARSGERGMIAIAKYKPDLVFLDIQMPGMNGFEMLAGIGQHHDTLSGYPFDVIFVSAFDGYGIQAVRAAALDYLLKPATPNELMRAVAKAKARTSRETYNKRILTLLTDIHKESKDQRIAFSMLGETRYLRPDEIIRVQSEKNYVHVYLKSKEKLMVAMGLYELEDTLLFHGFIKIHQSHIVNRLYIRSIEKSDNVSEVLMSDGSRVTIARNWLPLVKIALQPG